MNPETNFDRFLDEQLRDPEFARAFNDASHAWDIALKLTHLRESAGTSQHEPGPRAGASSEGGFSSPPACKPKKRGGLENPPSEDAPMDEEVN